ncbi:Uncharacterized protein Adt_05523 [Abeliophyllum distichum]|uniref:RNase H type-1 domain-containing protein n=1 Tax=Abeliophyllum distichum TaxID=126358 RepID=A0ABD1V4C1_9LAMI
MIGEGDEDKLLLTTFSHIYRIIFLLVNDPSVSVFKGYGLSREAEQYLSSHGLKNAIYSIDASDVQDDLFGKVVACPFRHPNSSKDKAVGKNHLEKRPQDVVGSASFPISPQQKHAKLDFLQVPPVSSYCSSCIIEFDGASKGNPGPAGAGAVLRTADGSMVFRLREGVGNATNNVARISRCHFGVEICSSKGVQTYTVSNKGQSNPKFGLKQSPKKSMFRVYGEQKFKIWPELCKVAKELKDQFVTFQICHVERDVNTEADAQANLGIHLKIPAHAPVPAPKKAPVPAPAHAPVPTPKKAPSHAPVPAPKKAPSHAPVPAPKKAPVHAPAHAPVPAPKKAPVHSPAHAPVPAPKKAPVHAPAHAPVPAPKKAPVHAPAHAPVPAPKKAPVHSPAHAPVPAPKKAPVHAPAHAPVPAPKKAPVHAPAHAPVPAPKKAPVHAPIPAPKKAPVHALAHAPKKHHVHVHPPKKGCVPKCEEYCKPVSPKRPCMKACTACCAKCKCVPGSEKCPNWDRVMIHGAMVKCP